MYRFVLFTALLLAFAGFCIVLIDWIQDYTTGFYQVNTTEAILETGGLAAYIFFAFRFVNQRLTLFK